jgi:hypothetical protein
MSERSRHRFWVTMGVAAGLSLTVSSVPAQSPPSNKDQLKCQTGAAKTLSKFVKSKAKCAQKCLDKARKTSGPYTGCEPPDYTDPATNACIFDPQKGAEAKARGKIDKGCAADCPDCYAFGFTCPPSEALVAGFEVNLDIIGVQIFCLEAGGTSPTKEEAKCEDTVLKSLVKFVGSKAKCYQTCVKTEFKGKIPADSCMVGSPADVATQECITKAETKAGAAIDKVCVAVPGNPPCYPPAVSGADWVAIAEEAVDVVVPALYCGSPSGAFLD